MTVTGSASKKLMRAITRKGLEHESNSVVLFVSAVGVKQGTAGDFTPLSKNDTYPSQAHSLQQVQSIKLLRLSQVACAMYYHPELWPDW